MTEYREKEVYMGLNANCCNYLEGLDIEPMESLISTSEKYLFCIFIMINAASIEQFAESLNVKQLHYVNIVELFADLTRDAWYQNNNSENKKGETDSNLVFFDDSSQSDNIVDKKRTAIRWSLDEEDAIIDGLKKFGLKNWKKIRDKYDDIFSVNGRTADDISKKWNRMKYSGKYNDIALSIKESEKKPKRGTSNQELITNFFKSPEQSMP